MDRDATTRARLDRLERNANAKGWQCSKPLDRGGQGVVAAWIIVDDHNRISKRIAVKDTYYNNFRHVETFDCIDLTLAPEPTWLLEAGVMDAMRKANGATLLASMRMAATNPVDGLLRWSTKRDHGNSAFVRLHLDYCPYKPLDGMLWRYAVLNGVFPLPEPFI